eukprot:79653_1
MQHVDLSTFKDIQKCACNNNYKQCGSITRLLLSLKYYSTLNITENDNDAESFRKFMNDVYYELINDYIHFNNKHTNELEHINSDLTNDKACQITTCIFTSRHHNTKTNKKNNLDDIMNFYMQTMDSLHFYLFHCYDVGIRTKKQDEKQQEQREEAKKDD